MLAGLIWASKLLRLNGSRGRHKFDAQINGVMCKLNKVILRAGLVSNTYGVLATGLIIFLILVGTE